MNIYVSNLSFNVQDEDLREFFTEYGEVSSAKVITDKFTGKSRGFGFVEMPDDEAARKAISELDNGTVEGRTIKVMEAKPKEERPARNNADNAYTEGEKKQQYRQYPFPCLGEPPMPHNINEHAAKDKGRQGMAAWKTIISEGFKNRMVWALAVKNIF